MERHMARFMEAAKSIQTAEGTKEAITLLQQNSTDIAPIAGYPGFVLARTEQAIDSLLSLPVSRFRLFTAKYTAGVIGFVCFTAISIGSTIPLSLAYSLRPQISNFLTMIFLGIIFAWAIYSASMFISAFARSKTTVYSIMGGVLVVMYALNIIAGLKQSISWLRYLSIFNYFKANMALMHNQITGLSIFILISAIIIFTVPAIYLFNRRDIYV
jgi:ABC-2 type transport system permease protein